MKTPVVVTKDQTGVIYYIPEHWHDKQLQRWMKRQKERRQHTHAQKHIRASQPKQLQLFNFETFVTNITS